MNTSIPSKAERFEITDFGAIGDGRTLNTAAIRKASEACRDAGGGILRIPDGTFLTGIIEIYGGTTLLIEKGGRLLASPRLEDHLIDGASVGLLYARDARDIVLTGEGILDGNAPAFFDETRLHGGGEDFSIYDTWQKRRGLPYGTNELIHGPIASPGRPGNMLVFARCQNLRIEKLTITGAAYWTLHCADCEDVAIENLRIENDLRHPNNDGIHLTTCRRASIRGCDIASGDDCIAITGFRDPAGESQIAFGLAGMPGVCGDIEISDCRLVSHSAAVRIGYGHNPVRGVRIRGLDIRESNRGIGIFARQSDVEDVTVEDCRIETALFHGNWWGRGEPIQVSAVRFGDEPQLFQVRRIRFQDIRATGENAITLFAEEPGAIDGVDLIRIHGTLRRGGLFEQWGGNLELRPASDAQHSFVPGGTSPLWAVGVARLNCEDCEWRLDGDAGPEFSAEPHISDR